MRIGARVWKTGLAVALAITVSMLLGLDRPVFAGIAAIICMQPTIAGSVRKGVERMQATIIGAVFALFSLILMDTFPILQAIDPLMIGATVLVVMAVTLRTGWADSLVLAAATVVVIMILPEDENMYSYSLSRTIITFVGIIVATAVNAVFITPRYSEALREDIGKLARLTSDAYRQSVEAFCLRDAGLAKAAEASFAEGEEILANVTTTVTWIEEEAALRQRMWRQCSTEEAELMTMVDILGRIRQSALTIQGMASETLNKPPHPVYQRLNESALPGFEMFERISLRLAGGKDSPVKGLYDDSAMLEPIFRSMESEPGERVPFMEVSVAALEIRKVTSLLAELDECIGGLVRA